MKKQNIIIICLVVILFGIILFLIGNGYFKEEKNSESIANDNSDNSNEPAESDVESIYNSPNWFLDAVQLYQKTTALNDEQTEQLEKLKKIEQGSAGSYLRLQAVINGKIAEDAPRIDLKTAKKIANQQAKLPIFLPADYIGGSGMTRAEFWLDNDGNKKLVSYIISINTNLDNLQLRTSYNISRISSLHNPKREFAEEELKGLNEQKIEQLEAIRAESNLYAGIYYRQEAIIRGLIDEDAPRLDVGTAKDIILSSSSFEEILSKIEEAVPYPDYIGGTDNSRIEYRINNSDYDKIVVLTQYEEIILFQNSTPAVVTLYENTKEIVTENNRFSLERDLQEYEIRGLNEEQIEKLRAVREKGYQSIGVLYRQEAIIRGLIDEDAPRLDAVAAKEIIANNSSYKEVLEKFFEVQYYPDFAGGSGYSKIEYWLDETGDEKIFITVEFEGITLFTLSEDGSLISEILN